MEMNEFNNSYSVSTSIGFIESVTITSSVDGFGQVQSTYNLDAVPIGAMIEVYSIPDPGNRFEKWSGDSIGSLNPIAVEARQGAHITAHFLEQVDISTKSIGGGEIRITPDGTPVDKGKTLQLEAVPSAGWSFQHWSGALNSSNPVEEYIIDVYTEFEAVFGREWESWRQAFFNASELQDGEISGFFADADEDGLANGIEAQLGLDPRTVDAVVAYSSLAHTSSGEIIIEIDQTSEWEEFQWHVESSDDLVDWELVFMTQEIVSQS